MESIVGAYEGKIDGQTMGVVLLKNGIAQGYKNGKKNGGDGKWKVINKEIYAGDEDGKIAVLKINKDGSLNLIAAIDRDGKRINVPKEFNLHYKRIK